MKEHRHLNGEKGGEYDVLGSMVLGSTSTV
jgi:hypothetical protein